MTAAAPVMLYMPCDTKYIFMKYYPLTQIRMSLFALGVHVIDCFSEHELMQHVRSTHHPFLSALCNYVEGGM